MFVGMKILYGLAVLFVITLVQVDAAENSLFDVFFRRDYQLNPRLKRQSGTLGESVNNIREMQSNQQSGRPQQGGFQQGSGFNQPGGFQQGTGFNQQGGSQQGSGFNQPGGFQQGTGFNQQGGSQQGSGFNQPGGFQGGFNQQTSQNGNQGSTSNQNSRVEDCVRRCYNPPSLLSVCGTDNVSYRNQAYFNCVKGCGRPIEIQHHGDCYTTRGAPTINSVG